MIIEYDQIDVLVNNSGVLADSVSIASENSIQPLYTIGKYGVRNQIPSGPVRSSFSLNYFPITTRDPTYDQLNTIKGLVDSIQYSGVNIVVGGITGSSCFLKNYSIQISPNQLLQVRAVYENYIPLSGELKTKNTSVNYYANHEQISHAWTTYISSNSHSVTAPTYDFDYSFSANWEPVYVLGKKEPKEVHLLDVSENMSFTRDAYQFVRFSGEATTGSFITEDFDINVHDYNLVCGTDNGSFVYNVSGSYISKSDINVSVDDILRTRTIIQKFS